MKIKELKHNHSLTDLLKVLLFSILMLAPILAIGVKCGYVMLNKNAYQSYSGKTSYIEYIPQKTNELTTVNDFVIGNVYSLKPTGSQNNSGGITPSDFFTKMEMYNNEVATISMVSSYGPPGKMLYFYDSNNTTLLRLNSYETGNQWQQDNNVFICNEKPTSLYIFNEQGDASIQWFEWVETPLNILPYNLVEHEEIQLDNVFYYAIDEVAQEPLFNWTQNTAIYTGVNAMCTGMEITNPIIPILITYWFLLTCIYVIIDILIKGFTMLTHLIGSKLA